MIQENCVLNSYSILLNGLNVVTNRANILTKNIQNSLRNNQSGSFDSRTEMLLSQIAEFESELESVDIETQYYSFKLNELKEAFGKLYPGKSEQVLEFFNDEFAKTKTKLERIKVKEFLSNLERQARVIRIQYPWQGYSINDLASVTGVLSKQIENYIDKNVNTDNIVDVEFFYDLAQTIHITQANINAIDISKNVIFTTLTKLENEFNRIPYQEIDKARVIRTTKFNNSLNTKLALKKQKLLSKENEYYPKVNSVTTALVPTSYFSPNIGLNIFIGALLGSLIGIFLALSSTSDKIEEITSADDLVDFGYKIVAKIPTFPIGAPVLLDTMKENEKATIGKNLTAPFENIETFLRYGNLDKTLKTILVTSGQNEEGKSLIATNIAITLANKGNKVILVDTDVINPQQHKNFKIKATPSLAHYLFRKKELDEIIKNTYNQNLDIITSIEIPQNPSVILSSERMKNFMDHVKESYDFIVYDSCSLTEINEVAVLANNIDEVLLLIRAGKSKIPDVLETEKILKRNGISRFNVILNEIES